MFRGRNVFARFDGGYRGCLWRGKKEMRVVGWSGFGYLGINFDISKFALYRCLPFSLSVFYPRYYSILFLRLDRNCFDKGNKNANARDFVNDIAIEAKVKLLSNKEYEEEDGRRRKIKYTMIRCSNGILISIKIVAISYNNACQIKSPNWRLDSVYNSVLQANSIIL